MIRRFYAGAGAVLTIWLLLWRTLGDRWGWLGMLNAWAEWGLRALAVLGIGGVVMNATRTGGLLMGAATVLALPERRTGFPPLPPQSASGGDFTFTLFSANLFKRNPSVAAHIDLIRQHTPDIICLQELSPHFATELLAGLGTVYPYQALRPEKGSYGYGVLSRFPIRETGFWNRPGVKAWGQRVEVTFPDGRQTDVYNVHLFPPMADDAFKDGLTSSFRAREGQVRLLQAEIAARARPALVIGDWNFSDTSDAYRIACEQLYDAAQSVGAGRQYTWPQLAFPVKQIRWNPRMLRLDYCFHNAHLRPRALECLTSRTGSDHCPLVVTMAFAAPADNPLSDLYPAHDYKIK